MFLVHLRSCWGAFEPPLVAPCCPSSCCRPPPRSELRPFLSSLVVQKQDRVSVLPPTDWRAGGEKMESTHSDMIPPSCLASTLKVRNKHRGRERERTWDTLDRAPSLVKLVLCSVSWRRSIRNQTLSRGCLTAATTAFRSRNFVP